LSHFPKKEARDKRQEIIPFDMKTRIGLDNCRMVVKDGWSSKTLVRTNHAENALPGVKIQMPDGTWVVKKS
jgi:hypothetical protein